MVWGTLQLKAKHLVHFLIIIKFVYYLVVIIINNVNAELIMSFVV